MNYVEDLFSDYHNFRNKKYSTFCLELLKKRFSCSDLWLTHSATGALEMIAKAIKIKQGDEVILSSFTFVSTANAFVSHGAIPVFVDISPEDFNITLEEISKRVSPKTRAVVVTHYGGQSNNIDEIVAFCRERNLILIEDAAMAYGNSFQGKSLGTFGDFGVISFDITKQISAVQGGLLICNRGDYSSKLDQIYHIGTDRTQFLQANKPYYEWVNVGSKYQMNELNALALYDQLRNETTILSKRNEISKMYFRSLSELKAKGVQLIPEKHLDSNLHLFYLVLTTKDERNAFIEYFKTKEIEALFHYIPLHNSEMGQKFCNYTLPVTEATSSRLVRLPLHVNLTAENLQAICDAVKSFWK